MLAFVGLCVRFANYDRSIKSIAYNSRPNTIAISSPAMVPSILGTGLPAAHVSLHHDLVKGYMCLPWGADCTGRRQRGGTSRVWVGPELSSVFYARKNLVNKVGMQVRDVGTQPIRCHAIKLAVLPDM